MIPFFVLQNKAPLLRDIRKTGEIGHFEVSNFITQDNKDMANNLRSMYIHSYAYIFHYRVPKHDLEKWPLFSVFLTFLWEGCNILQNQKRDHVPGEKYIEYPFVALIFVLCHVSTGVL